jgi:hypothetical protein
MVLFTSIAILFLSPFMVFATCPEGHENTGIGKPQNSGAVYGAPAKHLKGTLAAANNTARFLLLKCGLAKLPDDTGSNPCSLEFARIKKALPACRVYHKQAHNEDW